MDDFCSGFRICVMLVFQNDDISARHRLLLSMYDESSLGLFDNKKEEGRKIPWKELPPKDSSLSKELYFYFYEFVMALRGGDVDLAKKSFDFLEKHFNMMCIKLAMKLLEDVMHKGGLDKRGFGDKFLHL